MKNIIIFNFIVLFLLAPAMSLAHEGEVHLPEPGLLPDSPFYFVKRVIEGFGTLFTFGAEAKAERYLLLAERRLAEAHALFDTERGDVALEAIFEYNQNIEKTKGKIDESKAKGVDTAELEVKIAESAEKHVAVLNEVLERAPEAAKEGLIRAIDASSKVLDKKIEGQPEGEFEEPVFCTQEYDPVCGVDGKTYGNRCVAELQNKIRVAYEGECKAESAKPAPKPSPVPIPKAPEPQSTAPAPAMKEFVIEADDNGFYPSGNITVNAGDKVKITFKVRQTGVYFGGLDFRASPYFASAQVQPGGQTTVEFTADKTFIYRSYWPLSGVLKASATITVE